ncbi:pentatricopeptide repeat-containing protein At4g14850 [Cucurbita pepo subsp. pepo]|uniref:pentatricopeptide repeat-containing protein At4g14850 n=1 Tax=Cucurbita pepo subsp. pepo TaxID=3664 RepID=UPI000C9D9F63|nr:pentatricopeptide repeat-containing protein At4g14850 [Cucurbita pepo subsp. pepo]
MPFLSPNSLASLVELALSIRSSLLGRVAHAQILKTLKTPFPAFLYNHLVNMYAKLDQLNSAELILELAPCRSVVTWTSLIAGSVQNGRFVSALFHFSDMLSDCVRPNDFTFPCVFKASTGLRMAMTGKQVHALAVKEGLINDVFVGCSAFDMYSKLGLLDDAYKLFVEMPHRNLETWNAYISNSVLHGRPEDSAIAFIELLRAGGKPDSITFCAFLNACSDKLGLEPGCQLHGFIIRSGCGQNVSISNGLIDFYGKCGEVVCSEVIFDRMGERNSVSWSSLIAAYVQNNEEEKACCLFLRARKEDIKPTDFMVSSVLCASAGLSEIELGRSVQALAVKACVEENIFVGSALVDMYGKCGSIDKAEQAFNEMPERNLVSWNALLGGYAHQGYADKAVALLEEMASAEGIAPNYVSLVCALSACSRAGDLKTGIQIFESMKARYGIEPGPEHYACLVDLFGRAGMVECAYDFIRRMPFPPTISIWGALLGACRMHGKPELGKLAAEKLFELDPKDSGNHVVLSNMLAATSRWEEVTVIRNEMKEVGIKKGAGFSWITVNSRIRIFQAKDKSYEKDYEIQDMLGNLRKEMQEAAGSIADANFALFEA